nr:MAG TPA: hypothetical protein [Bacteriophage sp.]DAU46315.1 MAG TPA: hypothetical protein [Bacteriophage sp.]
MIKTGQPNNYCYQAIRNCSNGFLYCTEKWVKHKRQRSQ